MPNNSAVGKRLTLDNAMVYDEPQEEMQMKRFTDTSLWEREWFMTLSPCEKLAWFYVKDHCDNVGVWVPNFILADFCIGAKIEWGSLPSKTNGNIVVLENGKWFLVDYIKFQHPDLFGGSQSNACLSYIKLLKDHNLIDRFPELIQALGKPRPSQGLAPKERVQVRVKVKEEDKEQEKEIDEVLNYFKEKTGSGLSLKTEALRSKVRGRLAEGYTVDDCKRAIAFVYGSKIDNPDQRQYIRIDTIFAPTKFAGYVDAQRRETR